MMKTVLPLAAIDPANVAITVAASVFIFFVVDAWMTPAPPAEPSGIDHPDKSVPAKPWSVGARLALAGIIIGVIGAGLCALDFRRYGFASFISLFVASVGGMLIIVGLCLGRR